MDYVLQFGEMAHEKAHCYHRHYYCYYYVQGRALFGAASRQVRLTNYDRNEITYLSVATIMLWRRTVKKKNEEEK